MGLKTIVIFVGLCVPFFLGTIWAVVDVAQKDFGTMGKKASVVDYCIGALYWIYHLFDIWI